VVVLSGEQIHEHIRLGKIVFEPFDEKLVGPNQVDLRPGSKFKIFKDGELVDPHDEKSIEQNTELVDTKGKPFVLHISSGHVNPGSGARGQIPVTLEILNMNPSPVKLYPGIRMCQLLFYTMDRAVRLGYDDLKSKYAGELEPSGSLVFTDNLSPR
jgi:dCTP deaminase